MRRRRAPRSRSGRCVYPVTGPYPSVGGPSRLRLLQLLKVLARAGRKEQGGPVSLLIREPKPDLAVELDSACRPSFGRLRHDRQVGNQLTASAVITGKCDALQLRMRSPQIDFGCFEKLA